MEVFTPLSSIRLKKLKWYIKALNPVAYYTMWEESGAVAKNYAPTTLGSLNGTIVGATIRQPGQVGKAYDFDGTNDVINFGARATTVVDNLTVVALINATLPQSTGFIFYNGDDDPTGWGMAVGDISDGSGSKLIGLNGGVGWINSSTTLTSDTWNLVGMVRRSGTWYFYKDGVEDNTSNTSTPNAPSDIADIGAQRNGGTVQREADAIIQHVAVFETALTQPQMLKLAQIAGLA